MISLHKDPQNPHVLVVEAPYNKGVLASLKATVPYTDRTWNPTDKVWLISEQYGEAVAKILKAKWPHFRSDVTFPIMKPQSEDRIIKMEYIGVTKERDNGQESSFGYVDGDWTYIFPRNVLEGFFTGFVKQAPKKSTLYTLLQVDPIASAGEVKAGFRRMARLWHPDVNKEPKAHDMFIRIKEAYDILKAPGTRLKYDIGLKLEAGQEKSSKSSNDWRNTMFGYRSPLTCGMLHVTVNPGVRSVVTKIHKWQDITNPAGQILVTSWKKGDTLFKRSWV